MLELLWYAADILLRAALAIVARVTLCRLWAWLRKPRPKEDWNTMKE